MTHKLCFRCDNTKPLTDFYRHPAMSDGRLGKCKECTKADARAHRVENLELVQAYDRKRGQDPKRKDGVKKRYHDRYAGTEAVKESRLRWLANNQEKRKAHAIVGHAIRDGKLTPRPCVRCGTVDGVHGHHEDYSKPLEVMWLCREHHGERHREINKENRDRRPPP